MNEVELNEAPPSYEDAHSPNDEHFEAHTPSAIYPQIKDALENEHGDISDEERVKRQNEIYGLNFVSRRSYPKSEKSQQDASFFKMFHQDKKPISDLAKKNESEKDQSRQYTVMRTAKGQPYLMKNELTKEELLM